MGRLTSLLLLLWVGGTASKPLDLEKRIIGGQDCVRPSHVYVRGSNRTHTSMCGGSLISNKWVLTATHCQQRTVTVWTNVGQNLASRIPIQTGRRKIFRDRNGRHDIMLLKLKKPVSDDQTVGLPDCSQRPKKDDELQMAGYGPTVDSKKAKMPNTLQCAVIKLGVCLPRALIDQKKWDHQHLICGKTAGVAVCSGDSGGGLVFNGKIYGVISHTYENSEHCGKEAVFMDVCNKEYLDWITKITGIQPRV